MTHYIPTLLYNFLITHIFTLSFYRSPPFTTDCNEASISLQKHTSGKLISLHLWNNQQMLAVIQMSNPCTFMQDPSMTKSDCGIHWSLLNTVWCVPTSWPLFGFYRSLILRVWRQFLGSQKNLQETRNIALIYTHKNLI